MAWVFVLLFPLHVGRDTRAECSKMPRVGLYSQVYAQFNTPSGLLARAAFGPFFVMQQRRCSLRRDTYAY